MSQHADSARSFATHDFASVAAHLADDVRWVLVGAATLTGKDAVSAAYQKTLHELESTGTHFRELRVVEAPDSVVVQAVADYTERDGSVSVVASCDVVDFTDDVVTVITSYTVELDDGT